MNVDMKVFTFHGAEFWFARDFRDLNFNIIG